MQLLEDKGRKYKRFRPSPNEKVQLAQEGLQWVLSSNVSAVGKDGNDLIIRFHNGSLYRYFGQADLYDAMLASNSKGHFVWVKLRKPKVAYAKIGSLPLSKDKALTDEQLFNMIDTGGLLTEQRLRDMGMFIPMQEDMLRELGLTTFQ